MSGAEKYNGQNFVHYLWHLHNAKVIEIVPAPDPKSKKLPKITSITTPIWDQLEPNPGNVNDVRVAVIDNGCNSLHSHLKDVLVDQIDFATHRFGATYDADAQPSKNGLEEENYYSEGVETKVFDPLDILTRFPNGPVNKLLRKLANKNKSKGVVRKITSYTQDFARHGTLTAGLIGARPSNDEMLQYFGVDPFCKIIPIKTPFTPGFRQLSLALIYAFLKGADVICMPRGATPIDARAPSPEEEDQDGEKPSQRAIGRPPSDRRINDMRLSRLTREDSEYRELFETLLIKISKKIPVLLAAGNDGRKDLAYPASLATEENSLITVGSVNGANLWSSYSSGWDDKGLTIYAPSDDAEQSHEGDSRYDEGGDRAADHNLEIVAGSKTNTFVGWTVFSTDIPGLFGQASGRVGGFAGASPATESSSFASFGGTSAAVAIAAGAVSLAQRAHRIEKNKAESNDKDSRLSGQEIKDKLISTGDDISGDKSGKSINTQKLVRM